MKRALLVFLLTAVVGSTAAQADAHGLRTAIVANGVFGPGNDELQFARIKGAGATAVRIALSWRQVVHRRRGHTFDAADPADPAYRWGSTDEQVQLAHRAGLSPIITVYDAPSWAQAKVPAHVGRSSRDGPYRPDPSAYARFARALASRYSGSFRTEDGDRLPRVHYWIAWNEPNIYLFLTPQRLHGQPFSPGWYRRMLNAFARAVHAVHSDNLVVAGALAPFGTGRRISPLPFMRRLLCMSKDNPPRPTCAGYASFDVWSHHPYTRGDPFHHATSPEDVSLGDLPRMHRLLMAAVRAHHVVSSRKVQFWVDEFSYDSSPPDPSSLTVPLFLHARWTAESLYQMWHSGVSLASWFLLRDEPVATSPYQSGLYFIRSPQDLRSDRPKPALTAFRFPFVAYQNGATVSVWGRTASSRPASVAIEVGTGLGWRRLATVHAGPHGIFTGRLSYLRVRELVWKGGRLGRVPGPLAVSPQRLGWLRARVDREVSWPFSLHRPADRFVLPFGPWPHFPAG